MRHLKAKTKVNATYNVYVQCDDDGVIAARMEANLDGFTEHH